MILCGLRGQLAVISCWIKIHTLKNYDEMRSFSVLGENYTNESNKILQVYKYAERKGCLFVLVQSYQTGANFAPVDFEIFDVKLWIFVKKIIYLARQKRTASGVSCNPYFCYPPCHLVTRFR